MPHKSISFQTDAKRIYSRNYFEVLFTEGFLPKSYLPKIQSICEIAFLALPANFPFGWASRYFL